jgi:fumarylacetoacetase
MSDSRLNFHFLVFDNILFGVTSMADDPAPGCATALDYDVIDLSALESDGFFESIQ